MSIRSLTELLSDSSLCRDERRDMSRCVSVTQDLGMGWVQSLYCDAATWNVVFVKVVWRRRNRD
ncbi:hypothetical protein PM082_007064 [Marasmius tenuissimus]|nr:hypothetical protein PM082_007064 [Marasmius tenuissimus]